MPPLCFMLRDSTHSTFERVHYGEVSDSPQNTALAELLDGIEDRRIRRKILKLLQYGEEAVRSLGEVDSALYLHEDGEEQLQIVSDAVLSHVRRLLEYLGIIAPTDAVSADALTDEGDLEFSVGGSGSGESSKAVASPSENRASGIAHARSMTDDDKWSMLIGEMDSLQYGLGSEIKEYDRRFAEALAQDRKEQALRDLNDATTSLMDGVFAVMITVYECFLGYAEPERMIPGHRDSLGKAIAVRRALAELRREVQELNRPIQDRESPAGLAETNFGLLVESLVLFIDGDTFAYLRSDDRKTFANFREILSSGNVGRNKHQCEGFAKYLDSLSFVSQRGVLIKHDTDLRAKMGTELDRALAYAAILPDVVCEAMHQSFVKGERLLGLDDQLDAVVKRWFSLSEDERNDVDEAVASGRTLRDLVKPAPVATSKGGDFF